MPHETVFIIDDDASVRDAMSLLLSLRGYAGATFACAEDFLAAWRDDWHGCVVADIRMPGLSGLDLQERLQALGSRLPVVVVTAHGDVAAARRAFLNRAVDFIEKPFDGDTLVAAVERALGRAREAAAEPAGATAPTPAEAPAASETVDVMLSPREYEVMQLLVQGRDNRRIAQALGISHRTVEVHKARVLAKLNVRSVIELVRLIDGQHGA